MPTDLMHLSRTEITSLRYASSIARGHVMIGHPHGSIDCYDALLNMAERSLDEPARLAAAKAEGVREGIEMAAREADDWYPRGEEIAAAIRRLSPPPAEPSDGWIEWRGGECPVAPGTLIEARLRDGDTGVALSRQWSWDHATPSGTADLVAYRIVKPPEPSAPVAPDWPTRCAALEADGIAARKRVAALEAENAALKARVAELVEGMKPLAKIGGEIDRFARFPSCDRITHDGRAYLSSLTERTKE